MLVDWLAPVDRRLASVQALESLLAQGAELLAPPLMISEVSNALLTGIRRGQWDGPTADEARALLDALPVQIRDDRRDLYRAWDLARRFDNQPFYDLIYVALAERDRTFFLTADAKLQRRLPALDFLVSPEELIA